MVDSQLGRGGRVEVTTRCHRHEDRPQVCPAGGRYPIERHRPGRLAGPDLTRDRTGHLERKLVRSPIDPLGRLSDPSVHVLGLDALAGCGDVHQLGHAAPPLGAARWPMENVRRFTDSMTVLRQS